MAEDQEKIIESARDQISAIDRKIFMLIKKREQLSAEIGEAKRELLVPDRDFKREKIVFDQAIALAHELNLPVKFATALQKLIIEASISRQEKDRIKNNFDHAPKSVLVIGGAGRLGHWLCHFFADSGHKITVIDKVRPNFDCQFQESIDESVILHDIIVVATPIRTSITIFQKLQKLKIIRPVIFDVSSVKTPVQDALMKLKASGAQVTSLHPMFGPSVELLFGKHIIRTSLGVETADREVDEIFRATSLHMVDMSIDEHDAVISILLSLSHMVNLIFIRALQKSQFPIKYLERFSSPTFSNLLAIARNVYSENPHLYFEIQALNPYTKNAYQHLNEAFLEFTSIVKNDNEADFVNFMKDGERFLLDHS